MEAKYNLGNSLLIKKWEGKYGSNLILLLESVVFNKVGLTEYMSLDGCYINLATWFGQHYISSSKTAGGTQLNYFNKNVKKKQSKMVIKQGLNFTVW